MKKHKVKVLLLSIIVVLAFNTQSFSQTFQWVKQEGSPDSRDQARKTAFDLSGNMYVIGTFGGLNGGSTNFGNVTLTSTGAVDVFIAKYDVNRNLVWIRQGGSIYYDYIYGLELDQSGNVYVSGIFSSSISNLSAPISFGNTTLQSFGRTDIFIVKYSNSGDLVWAKSFGGTFQDQLNSMSSDNNNNFYITGSYKSTIAFDNFTLVNNTGYLNTYIAKFNQDGNMQWVKNPEGTESNNGIDICTDGHGNSVITGYYYGNVTFDTTYRSKGENDIFLAKYNSSGNLEWSKSFGGIFFDYGLRSEYDPLGNIFIAGTFQTFTDLGNDVFLFASGGTDICVCKFDSFGKAQWARSASVPVVKGFTGELSPSDIITDADGNCYLNGYFSGAAVFGSDTLYRSSAGLCDSYLIKYNRAGEISWKKQIYSGGTDVAAYIFSNTLSKDNSGNIYVNGSFSGRATFDNIILDEDAGMNDLFIAKISELTGIVHSNENLNPDKFVLQQNYPNPFNPITVINYNLADNGRVTLKLFDIAGREVLALFNGYQNKGSYSINFDGKNLTSGIYFYRLSANGMSETKSMALIK